jgi:UPF0716 protein FxsA
MALFILPAFILYGWVEFETFIWVGQSIGGLATFLGIFLTAFVGIALLKSQTALIMLNWQAGLSKGEFNGTTLAGGLSLLLGALLMLLPGYITDLCGLICFLPGIRTIIGMAIVSRMSLSGFATSMRSRYAGQGENQAASGDTPDGLPRPLASDDVIEGDFSEKKDRK